MNGRVQELLRRALSLRNVVPLLIIVGAFAATFVPTPFGLQRDQLLLGLLAFLAIDALLERIELLANIEEDVGVIKGAITSRTGKDFLRRRMDFPRLENLIKDARKEIWVSGVSLDTMATLVGDFNSKLRDEGFKLRFLAIGPEASVVRETSEYLGGAASDLVARIRASLGALSGELVATDPEQVKIRTSGHRPALGYFIVDPECETGYMTVQNYLYQMRGSNVYPLLFLSKETDPYWFNIYLDDFKQIWGNAVEWEPGT